MRQMDTIANNLANVSTSGFRREAVVFSEFVVDTGADEPSLSMANGIAKQRDMSQGGLVMTGGTYDFAIEGAGFFQVQTPEGNRLTRAGSFTPSADGTLVAPDGSSLLDSGGAPVFVPLDARNVTLAADGTLSADGAPIAQIGIWSPADPLTMLRAEGTRFDAEGDLVPAEGGRLLQGFIEKSNVDPVSEIARMIQVQRAYELGQSFLDKEDERIRNTLRTVGQ